MTLTDYLPARNILGNNNQIRSWLVQPVQRMIVDSRNDGVELLILSGYRSFSAQQLAWNITERDFPDRVHLLVAQPGHSEHQLGTTIDFGSPDFGREFTKEFANTPEGVWLRENAHAYGFTMSYPEDGFAITGFEFEPWHFRYVGVENATKLNQIGMSLTEWQLTYLNQPCIPDTSSWPQELSQPAN